MGPGWAAVGVSRGSVISGIGVVQRVAGHHAGALRWRLQRDSGERCFPLLVALSAGLDFPISRRDADLWAIVADATRGTSREDG